MNTRSNLVRKENKYIQITCKAEYYHFEQMNNVIRSEFWNIYYQ